MAMAQVLIRDLDDQTLKRLKKRAADNHRSLQGELHAIITQTVEHEESKERVGKRLKARSPRARYAAIVAPIRENRGGVRDELMPGRGARRRNAAAPTGSVWNWLKRRSVGNLSKEEIDAYIRAERDSWHDSF
jgi:plasmid stability protein